MKKTIITIAALLALAALAFGITKIDDKNDDKNEKVSVDTPCTPDFRTTLLNNVPLTMTEEEVARAILTQYLDGLKLFPQCPNIGISDYEITYIGNLKKINGDFMMDVKFDFEPLDSDLHELKTAETTLEGEWIRGKQATLGILRGSVEISTTTASSTISYRLAI